MNHSFDVDIAVRFGMAEAVLIENIRWWLLKNKVDKRNFHEGRYWTYSTAKAYAELFPYMSEDKIQRLLRKLEDEHVLVSGNFNQTPHDRTKWYSLDESFLRNTSREIAESTNTYINHINTVTKKIATTNDPSFEVFWKAYPRKTNKGFARTVFNKLKPTEELLKKMLSTLDKQIPLWTDPKYIPHPSTWLNGERWLDEIEAPKSPEQLAKDRAYEEFKRYSK